MCTEVNIKEGMPVVYEALKSLEGYIKIRKSRFFINSPLSKNRIHCYQAI